MKICGIKFAPFWIPLERRLQTLAVFYYYVGIMYSGSISVFIGILLLYFNFYRFYFLLLLYIAWIMYDYDVCNRGGRKQEWFRQLKLWDYIQNYFPIRIVKTSELPASKNYLLVSHPHGILSCGFAHFCLSENTNFKKEFPDLISRALVSNNFLWQPFSRDQLMWGGACSVSKESIEWLLTREGTGNALGLILGGAAESLEAHPGTATLVLKRRKGFIKLALKHGASLVPVFSFGQNEIFKQVQNPEGSYLRGFQEWLNKAFRFTIPLYYGRGFFQHSFGLLPFRKPITVVIGKPIHLEVDVEPTNEKIDAIHQMYVDSLTKLFEEHKAKYGPNLQLIIK